MPIPVFTRLTARPIPDGVLSEHATFAMIGSDARELLATFGARNWFVFTALVLRSDAEGFCEATLPQLMRDTGLGRDTLQQAMNSLCEIRIDARRVLRKVPCRKFGAMRYVLFPDREGAPLAHIEDIPTLVSRRKKSASSPPPAPAPVQKPLQEKPRTLPLRWATDEEEAEIEALQVAGNSDYLAQTSSGEIPLLTNTQVAGKSDYSSSIENYIGRDMLREKHAKPIAEVSAMTDSHSSEAVMATEKEQSGHENPPPSDTVSDTPPGKKNRGHNYVPKKPGSVRGLVAIFIDKYRALYDAPPLGGIDRLGRRFKTAIEAESATHEEIHKAIDFWFNPSTKHFQRWKRNKHHMGHFIMDLGLVIAYATGDTERILSETQRRENRKEQAQLRDMQENAESMGQSDFLPPHLRAICTEAEKEFNATPTMRRM